MILPFIIAVGKGHLEYDALVDVISALALPDMFSLVPSKFLAS